MYLKAIEMHGFKSFPDKTRLNFVGGLTAVVGPNGSGKSNISDALRWVLGEQSTKTLRGAKMEDVIFGGTQLRKAMGYAQVTLYIDNADGSMPMDCDEVTITRKLYRSGDSEYKINDQNVRLKDICELFMDTGLGRDGYSMIGQGKIAEIVGAKSQNRREIFEEAAGISKFRYRKTEAERKLLAAQENLLRLLDIMSELEARVEPLKLQAEKASRFVGYAQSKKKLELSIWISQLEKTREQLRVQEDKVAASQEAHAEVEEELQAVERMTEEIFAQVSQCTLDIDNIRNAIRAQEESAAEAQSQIAVLENDIYHNNSSVERIRSEMSVQSLTDQELDAQLAAKQDRLLQMQAELDTAQTEMTVFTAQCDGAALEERQAAADLEIQRKGLSGLALALSEAKVAAVTAQAAYNEAQNRIQMLHQSQAEKEDKIKVYTAEHRDCTELVESIAENMQGLQNSAAGIAMKLKARQEKQRELESELRGVEQKSNEKLQRAGILEGLEQNMEGFSGSVKFIIGARKRGAIAGVHSAVSKLIEVGAQYTTAIETALGGALQNIVVDDDEVAKRAINMLKEAKAGRATFLPITSIKGNRLIENGLQGRQGFVAIASDLVHCEPVYKSIVESLLGRTVVAVDLNDAVAIARAYGSRFRVVTLDGQLVNAGGSLTGGFTAKSAGLLSRQPEIDKLKADAAEILRSADGVRTKLKELSAELSALGAQQLAIDSELKTANEDKIRYEGELKRITLSLEDLTTSKVGAVGQLQRLDAKLAVLKDDIENAASRVAGLLEQQKEAEAEIERCEQRHTKLHGQREAFAARRGQFEMDVLAHTKDIQVAQQAIAEMNTRKEGQSQRTLQHQTEIDALCAKNTEISVQIELLKVQSGQLAGKTEEAQHEIAVLQQRRQECEQRSTETRAREKDIIARKEQLARDLARVEEKKFSLQSEYDAIIARMWDEYEITRSEAQAVAEPAEDLSAAQRALAEVKAQIKALGTVNLEAIDEYEQVSQRYNFMKKQITDVEQSRDQLNKIIYDLTAQMREMFLDSFTKINENFGKIFAELFGGGKASLELTEESDVLEAGIEINVQPPGKLIKNLASLSGGEQAFVAIAIYFAILKVRPAPFCLLDEIEAALDDVNVVKYAQYLKRLGGKTQFVAITHRRGTMEEADVLYGVTMQEEGVSKLLELAVSELESKLGMPSNALAR